MKTWVVLLRPDGVVDAALGGAPSTWVGHELATAADAPGAVRNAARELVLRYTMDHARLRSVRTDAAAVELVIVEAVPLRKVHTPIGELLVRVLDVFASQAKSSAIELTVKQDDNVPAVFVLDREKITWALATLVGNALRYSEHRDGTDHPRVDVRAGWNGEELLLTVSDNGPGMPEQRAKWLFERDPSTGAPAGLALLMVRDVVVAHRGTIDVKTGVGKGTSFVLRLPKA